MYSLYFNHVPKTGGTYIMSSLIKAGLLDYVNFFDLASKDNVDIEDVKDKNFIAGHYGTYINSLKPNVKSFTILRNPIKRTISLYSTMYELYLKNPEDKKSLYEFESQYRSFLTHKHNDDPYKLLDYWLNDPGFAEEVSNNQSSYLVNSKIFLMYYGDTKKTTKFKLSDDINHKEINFNNVKESLDSMILIGTLENLNTFKDSLFEIVNKNFECNLTDINPEKEENVSDLSKYLYGKLNKSQINQIEELNSIDFEAWEYAKSLI